VPILAEWFSSANLLQVTFDQQLQNATVDETNWLASAEGIQWAFGRVEASGNRIIGVQAANTGPNAQDLVNYFAINPDVFGLDGTPVAPFVAYPLTVGP